MEWGKVLKDSELPDGQMRPMNIGGREVVVARSGENFFAFDGVCTHRHCLLSDGFLEGLVVECPCHGAQFDITTGAVLRLPATIPIKTYPVKVENGMIWVEI